MAEIVEFTAIIFNNTFTITNDSITLLIKLSDCSPSCVCHVQTNKTGKFFSINFPPNITKGSVTIQDLQPYTLYSFDTNCSDVADIKNYAIRTDVSRPSSPRDAALALNGQRLKLKWSSPSIPRGPIDEYHVTVNGVQVKSVMNNTELSYQMNEDYIQDTTYTMTVSACNKDTQTRVLCSDPKDAEVSYSQKNNKNNNTNSNILPDQSASISQISFFLMIFIQMLFFI